MYEVLVDRKKTPERSKCTNQEQICSVNWKLVSFISLRINSTVYMVCILYIIKRFRGRILVIKPKYNNQNLCVTHKWNERQKWRN